VKNEDKKIKTHILVVIGYRLHVSFVRKYHSWRR